MTKFNLDKARKVYAYMKTEYKTGCAWLRTANELRMTTGELSRAWNKAKKEG